MPTEFDAAAIRAAVSAAIADEEQHHRLWNELRNAAHGTADGAEREVALRFRQICDAIALVPDRLMAVEQFSAHEPVRRVLAAVGEYWGQPNDVIPDRFGLLGRVDDAVIAHTMVDRLNRWHLRAESAELVHLADQPDLELRQNLSDEADHAIMKVVDAIWNGTFDASRLTPFDPSIGIFAPVMLDVMPTLRGRGRETAVELATAADNAPRLYEVWFATNRAPIDEGDLSKGFAGQHDPRGLVHYGSCEVAVPRAHKFGSIGTAWWKRWPRLDFADDRLRVRQRWPTDGPDVFCEGLRAELASSEGRQLLFYLHGYNVSFDDATIRAAQLFADLKVEGVAAYFSWPSKASTKDYFADVERIGESEADIAGFLMDLAARLGDVKIHIIAHSMGNRGLARAIQRIVAAASRGAGIRFGQIILAAPDLSIGLFRDLAQVYPKISQRTTMYVSARDRALGLSKWLQDAPRAGFTPPVTVVPGIDTIEVTNIDVTRLGHGYYASAAPVLYDIDELLRYGAQPHSRLRLRPGQAGDPRAPYWVIDA
jgi:esterase/lipase superfamily enzyme/uncharacterized membrane protein YkvA (DUF1232 family)